MFKIISSFLGFAYLLPSMGAGHVHASFLPGGAEARYSLLAIHWHLHWVGQRAAVGRGCLRHSDAQLSKPVWPRSPDQAERSAVHWKTR